ncbi:UPF0276 protein [Prolixibacter bellariivorans]|uniref:UPF0276 protein n=1 Tax=Prolixibacter bellariivorans TaxID=314319 RepID=A0A5M4B0H5_9BACT|nr:DUF692 domain-containing protein [Prolixibacter bellariivorans]GET33107.1 UPF0276 protein [Prolixibacter bellariivorans]
MKNEINIGLGLRRDIIEEFLDREVIQPDFIEFAPENWIGMGGYWGKKIRQAVEKYPVTCHGLSLSLGSPEELDYRFMKELKSFLDDNQVEIFSEHLSYTKCANAHLYDLLPIPFREDAVKHVVRRIREAQDFLERPIAIENVSYYTAVAAEMDEATFISSIVEESGCQLLLDVNNVYVNAFNHGYDAKEFIRQMPLDKVAYIHMAGHEKVSPDLIIDTHGEAIIDPVYQLFDYTASLMELVPVLLERDFNFPAAADLKREMNQLRKIATKHWRKVHVSQD